MEIERIKLERFKGIKEATINLSAINILVGSNNSGKSSVLEGIHFSVAAAVATRIAGTKTFTQGSLLFCPTKHFVNLRHNSQYKNQSNFGFFRVYGNEDGEQHNCSVKIYRGRNEGNVGCEMSGSIPLRQMVNNSTPPFSVYVPGLSGIPQVEERRTESIIRRGVASGDANLYLRNVLLLIKEAGKLAELTDIAKSVFPGLFLNIEFDDKKDLHIRVEVSLNGENGRKTPLELMGTGVQQALQIFSYIVLFRPNLLLLDEPDSHLHPDNQGLLAKSLLTITSGTNTKIIISTHSRHLVDSLFDESNIVWLKSGEVYDEGDGIRKVPLLMDIGALDSIEKIREGNVDWVLLSEDSSLDLVNSLMNASGFEDDSFIPYSYNTSSNFQAALTLAEFISEIASGTKVIIHRDRDFLTENEVEWITNKIEDIDAIPFITEGSDIESYFINSSHLAELLEVDVEDIDEWQDEIAESNHNKLLHKYTRKRDEAKYLYRNRDEDPPDTLTLIGTENPLPKDKRMGKFMLRKIRGGMSKKFGSNIDVRNHSESLFSERLSQILNAQNI